MWLFGTWLVGKKSQTTDPSRPSNRKSCLYQQHLLWCLGKHLDIKEHPVAKQQTEVHKTQKLQVPCFSESMIKTQHAQHVVDNTPNHSGYSQASLKDCYRAAYKCQPLCSTLLIPRGTGLP